MDALGQLSEVAADMRPIRAKRKSDHFPSDEYETDSIILPEDIPEEHTQSIPNPIITPIPIQTSTQFPHKKRRSIDWCSHDKAKRNCNICSGCIHNKVKYNCAVCKGCAHGKVKRLCNICNGCLHGKLWVRCRQCRGK